MSPVDAELVDPEPPVVSGLAVEAPDNGDEGEEPDTPDTPLRLGACGMDGDPPVGKLTDGVDTDGVETDGVDTLGVDTGGVDTGGVETTGVETLGTETEGTETDGTVVEGTVADGTPRALLESVCTPNIASSTPPSIMPVSRERRIIP